MTVTRHAAEVRTRAPRPASPRPGDHGSPGARLRWLDGHRRPPLSDDALAGPAPLRKLFSKQQRAFYADYAPAGIGLEDLSTLGPIFILKLKATPAGYARKMVVELWLYPAGTRKAPRARLGGSDEPELACARDGVAA
jgi:hypothetical protein